MYLLDPKKKKTDLDIFRKQHFCVCHQIFFGICFFFIATFCLIFLSGKMILIFFILSGKIDFARVTANRLSPIRKQFCVRLPAAPILWRVHNAIFFSFFIFLLFVWIVSFRSIFILSSAGCLTCRESVRERETV